MTIESGAHPARFMRSVCFARIPLPGSRKGALMATLDHEKHITGDASPTAQPQYSEPDGGQVHGVFGLGAEHVQRESVKEILDILGVGDDRLVSHADEFWRSAATALDLPAPDGDAITTARFVIEHLGSWDEDYLSDDGKSLSLAAYNEVLSLHNTLTGGAPKPTPATISPAPPHPPRRSRGDLSPP